MRFCVVGPGAMGCLFGGYLKRVGFDVALLDRREDRVRLIGEKGIRIEGIRGEFRISVPAFLDPAEVDSVDAVLVCVKSYDTEEAVQRARPLVGKDTLVVTLQNGLGNVETIGKVLGETGCIVAGITAQGATVLGEGHIRHAGEGDTVLGLVGSSSASTGKSERLEALVACFERAGFPTRVAEDIQSLIWSKLVVNVGINALTALTHLRNGELVRWPGTAYLMERAVEESLEVARAAGVKIDLPDPVARVRTVCERTAANVSSMLQDVLKKRRTEIDYINGAIVREGERLGIATPVNRVLAETVRTIQETYDRQIWS